MDISFQANLDDFIQLFWDQQQEEQMHSWLSKENGSYSVSNTNTALFNNFMSQCRKETKTAQAIHDVFC